MPRADQATIDFLTDYFDAMETKDHERLGSYYADNITLTFANAPTITGRGAMLEQPARWAPHGRALAAGGARSGGGARTFAG